MIFANISNLNVYLLTSFTSHQPTHIHQLLIAIHEHYIRLHWIALDCIGLHRIALDCIALRNRIEIHWIWFPPFSFECPKLFLFFEMLNKFFLFCFTFPLSFLISCHLRICILMIIIFIKFIGNFSCGSNSVNYFFWW